MALPVFDESAEDEYHKAHSNTNFTVEAVGAAAVRGRTFDESPDGERTSHRDGNSVLLYTSSQVLPFRFVEILSSAELASQFVLDEEPCSLNPYHGFALRWRRSNVSAAHLSELIIK